MRPLAMRLAALALGGALWLGEAPLARACAFHGYIPDPTLVDLLIDTEQVVLARLDPADPARLLPVEALIGPDALPEAGDVAIPVPASMRARLMAAPELRVLLVRDGAYGPWQAVAVLDGGYRAVIERVLARQSAWLYGHDGDRLPMFAALVNAPNPDLRRLALQELDRAAYGDLKRLDLPVVRHLRRDIETGAEDLKPIRILLAGLSGARGFVPDLRTGLDRALRQGVPYAGAYATALIELEGPEAAREIINGPLSSEALPLAAREKLLEALAIHYKTAPDAVRHVLAREVAAALRRSPALRQAAARQFGYGAPMRMARTGEDTAGAGPAPMDEE